MSGMGRRGAGRGAVALPFFVACLALAGCRGEAAEAGWAGTVDTLANGAVEVRSPAEGLWEEGEEWRLVEELRIGTIDGEGPMVFGQVADVGADDTGRIYVLDAQAAELRAFGPDGTHVWTAGGEGQGPGELSTPAGLAVRDGRIWVVDSRNSRYVVYDTAGALVEEHPRDLLGPFGGWGGGFAPDGRLHDFGALMVEPGRFASAYVVLDPEMEPVDTIPLPEYSSPSFEPVTVSLQAATMSMRPSVPFSPGLVSRLEPGGLLWTAITDDYRIHGQTPEGDTVRVVSRAYEPVPVSTEERDSAIARLTEQFGGGGATFDASRIPAEKPPFEALTVTPDGHLWILTSPVRGDTVRTYDVFDPEGRYLGAVEAPDRIRPDPHVRGTKVYGYVTDELDVPWVVRWRLEKPGG